MRRRPSAALLAAGTCLSLLLAPTAYAATGDRDGDGVADAADNCPTIRNADQADRNGNGIGDACDDPDGDTLSDRYELETSKTNPDNPDTDGDGLTDGDEVRRTGTDPNHPDTDRDGVKDSQDNCPTTANPSQQDLDGNGQGDTCQFGIPDGGSGPNPGPAPVPTPFDGVPALVTDLSVLAQDGVAMVSAQTSSRTFSARWLNAASGAPLALDLPSNVQLTGAPVQVVLYDAQAKAIPVSVRWKYFPSTRTLSFSLQDVIPASVAAVRIAAPLFEPVCTSAVRCTETAAGFYNPLQLQRAMDAGDAVLTPTSLS
jgi:hypothetical protein